MDKFKEFGMILCDELNKEYENNKHVNLKDVEIYGVARSDARIQVLTKLIREYNELLSKQNEYDWDSFSIKNIIMVEP